jgi:hypothetical protein
MNTTVLSCSTKHCRCPIANRTAPSLPAAKEKELISTVERGSCSIEDPVECGLRGGRLVELDNDVCAAIVGDLFEGVEGCGDVAMDH